MKRTTLLIAFVFVSLVLQAQKGGESVYNFLQLTNAARVAALGGENVSLSDDDINLVFHNPALLSESMNQNMNLNFINYYAGVNYGYSSYASHKDGIGTFAAGVHYIDYGTFERRDEYGNFDGYFYAREYAMNLIYSRTVIDSTLRLGLNIKPILSTFEQYSSIGIAADLGALYTIPKTNTSIGLVFSNIGTQLVSYTGTREHLPFEIQAGLTQGLAHAPFRFNIQLQHLEAWNLTYEKEEDDDPIFGNENAGPGQFDILADKLMRHAVFGIELLLGENFHFDLGYNYKRRQEMKMNSWPGMVGFSWGFGLRISRFHVAYGRANYHLAGGTNHFSITTDLSSFYKAR